MSGSPSALDVGAEIDDAPVSSIQIRVFLLCFALAIFDGYDQLIIGYAAPSLVKLLHVDTAAMGPVFASVLLGAAIGGLLLGPLADRVGRKPILILSSLTFALFCGVTVLVTNVPQLLACRLLAGIGLGGATPCFVALASEYAPLRLRGIVTTLLWASYPIGGMLGGLVSAFAIPVWGWKTVFYIGGILPVLTTLAVIVALPESPRYLARISRRRAELGSILERIVKRPIPANVPLLGGGEHHGVGKVSALFRDGLATPTIMLWLGFFFAFILAVLIPLWAPTLLQRHGLSIGQSSVLVSLFNFGALLGMCVLGYLVDRFGASRVLATIFVISAVAIAPAGLVIDRLMLSGTLFTIAGMGAGGGAAGMVALTTLLYPTELRSTGIGWGIALGRIGQMAGPTAGGIMVALGWGVAPILAAFSLPALVAAVVTGYFGRHAQPRRVPRSIDERTGSQIVEPHV